MGGAEKSLGKLERGFSCGKAQTEASRGQRVLEGCKRGFRVRLFCAMVQCCHHLLLRYVPARLLQRCILAVDALSSKLSETHV